MFSMKSIRGRRGLPDRSRFFRFRVTVEGSVAVGRTSGAQVCLPKYNRARLRKLSRAMSKSSGFSSFSFQLHPFLSLEQ